MSHEGHQMQNTDREMYATGQPEDARP